MTIDRNNAPATAIRLSNEKSGAIARAGRWFGGFFYFFWFYYFYAPTPVQGAPARIR
ncbi:MAG TPA: hypothetical protein VM490_14230 [Armatimonadaceae bacterium]|nr:hypothetical protein [Armatimonadaceae bacterium]